MVTRRSVELQDVSVRRKGHHLLGPVSVKLADSGITVVLGPNGAGKTTFLRALHGVEHLATGQIRWTTETGERPSQAYVFQSPIMLRRTVRRNLAYPLKLAGLNRLQTTERVSDWAARIGLTDALDRPAPRLSGGEKQKLALARALAVKPDVLFLDEPCANLDAGSTREIEAMLLHARDTGTRIIMATHQIGQARRLASDVVFLLHGQVHEAGRAPEMFESPHTPEARAFFMGDIVG